jgi:hypothetical protein
LARLSPNFPSRRFLKTLGLLKVRFRELVGDHDTAANAHWQRILDHSARAWRKARSILFSLPDAEREALLDEF